MADVTHDDTNDVTGDKDSENNGVEDPWPTCENNLAGAVLFKNEFD